MAKTNHFKTVVFTEDFASKVKGEEWLCDSQLASQLVRVDKVAVYKGDSLPADAEETKVKTSKRVKK